MKEYNSRRYLLPEDSGHVTYSHKGEVKRALKNALTITCVGALGLVAILSTVAAGIAVRGEDMRIPLGENATLIDFYVNHYTYPESQSMDILEGYCTSPGSMAPKYQQPKQFLFHFFTDGNPSTEVHIGEICSR